MLRPEALDAVYAEFDAIDDDTWRKYLHVNERKYANTDASTWGPVLQPGGRGFASDRFLALPRRAHRVRRPDRRPHLDGGGLHRSLGGGYLNVHADFTAHHVHQHWRRRVNLLLYLNREWQPEWGGDLELWSKDMERCEGP